MCKNVTFSSKTRPTTTPNICALAPVTPGSMGNISQKQAGFGCRVVLSDGEKGEREREAKYPKEIYEVGIAG